VATTVNNIAGLLRNQGKYEDALLLYQRALAIWEKALRPNHPNTATSMNNMAELLRSQVKYEDALPPIKRLWPFGKKALGPDHPNTATSLNNMAVLLQSQGKYEDALPLYQSVTVGRVNTARLLDMCGNHG
jgi:tetratricopeptide (TPR) repeat protein